MSLSSGSFGDCRRWSFIGEEFYTQKREGYSLYGHDIGLCPAITDNAQGDLFPKKVVQADLACCSSILL